MLQYFTHFSLETTGRVIDKQGIPRSDAAEGKVSNEYPQQVLSQRNKKKYYADTPSCLVL